VPEYLKEMPDIEGDFFVINIWRELGRAQPGYMSAEPLSWTEIGNWANVTGATLTKWELETVRILSCEYVMQLRLSQDENCPAPYTPELTLAQKKQHAKLLRQRMRNR
jgi:hypothetical protein